MRKSRIRGKKFTLRMMFNSFLVLAFPLFEYLSANVALIQSYVDADTYKLMGLIAVGGNIILGYFQLEKK